VQIAFALCVLLARRFILSLCIPILSTTNTSFLSGYKVFYCTHVTRDLFLQLPYELSLPGTWYWSLPFLGLPELGAQMPRGCRWKNKAQRKYESGLAWKHSTKVYYYISTARRISWDLVKHSLASSRTYHCA